MGHSHGISTPCLCLSVCKKILNLRVWCLYGNRGECKQMCCRLIVNVGWVFCLVWQGMHESHVSSLLCLGKFQRPCSGDLGHCAARFPWCHHDGECEGVCLHQAAQGEGGGQRQLLWDSDDFQLFPVQWWTSQIPWVVLVFFKRVYKSTSTVNHDEKHSYHFFASQRWGTFDSYFFYLLLCLVTPEEDSKCLIGLSWRGFIKPFSEH